MLVYLIRHSTRETPEDFEDAEEGDPDADLTKEGEAIAKSLGQWMADNDEIPSLLIASDAVRGQQTAQLIAAAIEEAGFAPPDVETDASIGPHMSIRGTLMKKLADKAVEKVALVSHKGSIQMGLQQMGGDDKKKPTPMAMGELRILKVKRKSGKWKQQKQILPSDLGHPDSY